MLKANGHTWNTKIELKQLRYAVAAADYGSFRAAAEVLNVQQSTLSRVIGQLEYATSTIIFNRSPGGVTISPTGAKVIRMARDVLDQIDSLDSSLDRALNRFGSKLCVGFCTSLSTGALRASIVDFRTQFPQIELRTLERARPRLSTALRNGTLDIVVSTGSLPSIECDTQVLWSERILLALPEDHVLAKQRTIYWTDLRGQVLLMSRHDPYWELEHLVTSKLLSLEDRPLIKRHDVSRSILKSLISMKLGVGLMFESDIGVSVPALVFRELHDGNGASSVRFSMFWDAANNNPALNAYIRLLRDRYPSLS